MGGVAAGLLLLLSGCAEPGTDIVPAGPGTVTTAPRAAATVTPQHTVPGSPPPANLAGTPTSQTYAFRPTTLTMPSGTVAAVDPAGVGAGAVLEVPTDPARLGWWTGGARVGEPFGSVVIAGHVDSHATGIGVMYELLDMAVGAEVVVGDGEQRQRYRVTAVDELPKVRLAADTDVFRQDVDHRLILITCGGAFNSRTRSYADNIVVTAEPVDG